MTELEKDQELLFSLDKRIAYFQDSIDTMYNDPRFGWQQRMADIENAEKEVRNILKKYGLGSAY